MKAIKEFSDKKKKEFDMKQNYTVKKILKDECQTEGNSQVKYL